MIISAIIVFGIKIYNYSKSHAKNKTIYFFAKIHFFLFDVIYYYVSLLYEIENIDVRISYTTFTYYKI